MLGAMTHLIQSAPAASEALDVPGLIRRVRREADLNQRQLAEAVGVDQSTVARWEGGRSVPDVVVFARVLGLLDLRLLVVDEEGEAAAPMVAEGVPRDRQHRRFAAHLDLVEVVDAATYEPRPSTPRRARRDERRARLGWPEDHPTGADFARERRAAHDVRVARALERARERVRRRMLVSPGTASWDSPPPCSCPITCEDQPGCLPSCACACEPIGERHLLG